MHLHRRRAAAGEKGAEDQRNPGTPQRFLAHLLPSATRNSLAPLPPAWCKFKELGPGGRQPARGATMPDLIPHAPDNPDFARVIELRQLRDAEAFDFDIAPTESEASALTRLMGANAVRRMRFRGRLTRAGDGWQLDGELGATVVQPCVVTLEPVTTRIDVPVRRLWLPETGRPSAEVVLIADARGRAGAARRPHRPRPRRDRGAGAGGAGLSAQAGRSAAACRGAGRRGPGAAVRGAGGAAWQTRGGRVIKAPGGLAPQPRNRYCPRSVFRFRSAASGVTARAGPAIGRADARGVRAVSRRKSRSRYGCPEKQGHALQARHAPFA